MQRILVLGGTRYFGRRLVHLLLGQGYSVTIATRGLQTDDFGSLVNRMVVDRSNPASMRSALAGQSWDVVVDQLCYSPDDALIASDLMSEVGRYVMTSSQAVYGNGWNRESDFDPWAYPLHFGGRADFSYREGKRLAEAVCFQKLKCPLTAVRLPIVLGEDDYTGRLEFHIDRVCQRKTLLVPNPSAETTFISSAEAARVLLWLIQSSITGPINACSLGTVTLPRILRWIEDATGVPAVVASEGDEADMSPFIQESTRCLVNTRARDLGFAFDDLHQWLPRLIGIRTVSSLFAAANR